YEFKTETEAAHDDALANSPPTTLLPPSNITIAGYDAGIQVTDRPKGEKLYRRILLITPASVYHLPENIGCGIDWMNMEKEGYRICIRSDTVMVVGRSERGCLYGVMDLMEQLGPEGNFARLEEKEVNPAVSFRAIKFNLPWAPYRPGPANDVHLETCRDLKFWESFLDMMVRNRFNALTLWSTHLFPYMIRCEPYPEATPFTDAQLRDWKKFWKALFAMAKERGIETYLINWNIVVSPEFAREYGTEVYGDRSALVKRYTRESVTQLINEYEDLTGLGVTLADWMGNWGDRPMSPVERENWIEETFVAGIKQADRKVKFIHRAVLAGDPKEMRHLIDRAQLPEPTVVEIKFNWSHGHSTPRLSITHSDDEGTIMNGFWHPPPENYFIAWMIRNEDFFVLRWGEPTFIRDHIRLNNHPYVDGYFIGSEGYIPATDYSYTNGHPHKTWDYAFQKQWMFYYLWGRLLFEPGLSDEQLARELEYRYPRTSGSKLLEAYTLASRVPLKLATFYRSTWDFTLYSEGFLAPWTTGYDDGKSPFISLEELTRHETLDPNWMSIEAYTEAVHSGTPPEESMVTPPELAIQLKIECDRALGLIYQLREPGIDPTLESELDDLETWCYLGSYLSDKIRAGVAFQMYRLTGEKSYRQQCLQNLQQGILHWKEVIRLTELRYKPMPYVSMGYPDQKWPGFKSFHWMDFLDEVERDVDVVKKMPGPSS
ncbi:MAG: hypothetical protein ACWGNV_09240, partial [Bacteroidales bacterium]